MSHVIYKYDLPPTFGKVDVTMPKGADVLSVQVQHGHPVIWAMVKIGDMDIGQRQFLNMSTGHTVINDVLHEKLIHVGTVQLSGGVIVMHVFEVLESQI